MDDTQRYLNDTVPRDAQHKAPQWWRWFESTDELGVMLLGQHLQARWRPMTHVEHRLWLERN